MNLLDKGQDTDIQRRILMTLREIGFREEEITIAREFFDFSREPDLSLLSGIRYRELPDRNSHRNSIMLFQELLRLPKARSFDATDRYVLFLDAAAGNTIRRYLLFQPTYFYHLMQPEIIRLRHAYETACPAEDFQPKMLAFLAYGVPGEYLLCQNDLIEAARNHPTDFYQAGKRFCNENNPAARETLYAVALAYCREEDFTDDERKEMEACLLACEQGMSEHDTAGLENTVLMLFMGMNSGPALKQRLRERFKQNCDLLLSAIQEHIPYDHFEKNMEFLTEAAEEAGQMTVEKIIRCTVKNAVSSDAFRRADTTYCAKNTIHFLELLSQKYTQSFLNVMTSKEAVGAGGRFGYLFNYYGDLLKILERTVPGAKERYGCSMGQQLTELTIQREVMDVRSNVRKTVLDYLRGQAPLSVLESVRVELTLPGNPWNESRHEEKMLGQLGVVPDFYERYVAYKMLQHPSGIVGYLNNLFLTGIGGAAEMKRLLRAAAAAGIPLADRIGVFEKVYSLNDYWEEKRLAIMQEGVGLMAENSPQFDELYAEECPRHEVVTRCCYARYLERMNGDPKNRERLLALCGDSSKEVRRTVIGLIGQHREYEPEVLAMLSSRKQAMRENAVEIIALWGVGEYRAVLEEAAGNEKSVRLADKMRALLGTSAASGESGAGRFSPITLVRELHKGGRKKKIAWLYTVPLPTVHFRNGSTADEEYLQALILCYSTMPVPGRNENAFLLAAELNEDELHRYAAEIFSRWYSEGAEAKTKWALYFAVIHGGDGMVDIVLKCIRDWAENMRGAIAAEAVRALSLNGSSLALMTVDNLARKFKQKQVKKAAAEAMESAAEALGITADELSDRIVPDLGFRENCERVFDYGARRFRVVLTPALEMEIYDESGKKLKNLPSPGKKDDEELAGQAYGDFKSLKKQLRTVVSVQKLRLETAFMADRRWERTAWENLFVKNPVMHSFAIGLIWTAWEEEESATFRYLEDGSFTTCEEEEYVLPEDCQIGLAHPIELDADTLSAWREQLCDYEIIQPIAQLDRKTYRPEEQEQGKLDLNRFCGRSVNALTLLGRTVKYGWNKGSAQDAGMFYVFYREDATRRMKNPDGSSTLLGNAAELHFSGTYIAVEDESVTIESVRFYRPGTIAHGSYLYDEADDRKAIPLDRVPQRYFSEIVLQLEEITREA